MINRYNPNYQNNHSIQSVDTLETLVMLGLNRYMEALDQKEQSRGVIWLTSERIQRTGSRDDDHLIWVRLGADEELRPGVEWFDLGLPVENPFIHRPIPLEQSSANKHLYVRKWKPRGNRTSVIDTHNALDAAYEIPRLISNLPVHGLMRKLSEYRLHNIRVWQKGYDGNDNVA